MPKNDNIYSMDMMFNAVMTVDDVEKQIDDIQDYANKHTIKIDTIVENSKKAAQAQYANFVEARKKANEDISENLKQMLSADQIQKVFDTVKKYQPDVKFDDLELGFKLNGKELKGEFQDIEQLFSDEAKKLHDILQLKPVDNPVTQMIKEFGTKNVDKAFSAYKKTAKKQIQDLAKITSKEQLIQSAQKAAEDQVGFVAYQHTTDKSKNLDEAIKSRVKIINDAVKNAGLLSEAELNQLSEKMKQSIAQQFSDKTIKDSQQAIQNRLTKMMTNGKQINVENMMGFGSVSIFDEQAVDQEIDKIKKKVSGLKTLFETVTSDIHDLSLFDFDTDKNGNVTDSFKKLIDQVVEAKQLILQAQSIGIKEEDISAMIGMPKYMVELLQKIGNTQDENTQEYIRDMGDDYAAKQAELYTAFLDKQSSPQLEQKDSARKQNAVNDLINTYNELIDVVEKYYAISDVKTDESIFYQKSGKSSVAKNMLNIIEEADAVFSKLQQAGTDIKLGGSTTTAYKLQQKRQSASGEDSGESGGSDGNGKSGGNGASVEELKTALDPITQSVSSIEKYTKQVADKAGKFDKLSELENINKQVNKLDNLKVKVDDNEGGLSEEAAKALADQAKSFGKNAPKIMEQLNKEVSDNVQTVRLVEEQFSKLPHGDNPFESVETAITELKTAIESNTGKLTQLVENGVKTTNGGQPAAKYNISQLNEVIDQWESEKRDEQTLPAKEISNYIGTIITKASEVVRISEGVTDALSDEQSVAVQAARDILAKYQNIQDNWKPFTESFMTLKGLRDAYQEELNRKVDGQDYKGQAEHYRKLAEIGTQIQAALKTYNAYGFKKNPNLTVEKTDNKGTTRVNFLDQTQASAEINKRRGQQALYEPLEGFVDEVQKATAELEKDIQSISDHIKKRAENTKTTLAYNGKNDQEAIIAILRKWLPQENKEDGVTYTNIEKILREFALKNANSTLVNDPKHVNDRAFNELESRAIELGDVLRNLYVTIMSADSKKGSFTAKGVRTLNEELNQSVPTWEINKAIQELQAVLNSGDVELIKSAQKKLLSVYNQMNQLDKLIDSKAVHNRRHGGFVETDNGETKSVTLKTAVADALAKMLVPLLESKQVIEALTQAQNAEQQAATEEQTQAQQQQEQASTQQSQAVATQEQATSDIPDETEHQSELQLNTTAIQSLTQAANAIATAIQNGVKLLPDNSDNATQLNNLVVQINKGNNSQGHVVAALKAFINSNKDINKAVLTPETINQLSQQIANNSKGVDYTGSFTNANQHLSAIQTAIETVKNQVEIIKTNTLKSGNKTGYTAKQEDIGYHSGIIGRTNKAETNGMFYGSARGTGYYGTGYYFVDTAHKNQITNHNGHQGVDQPFTSVDLSKYDNLFKANTDKLADALHEFLKRLTIYTHGDKSYNISRLYSDFVKIFGDDKLDRQQFKDEVAKLTEYMSKSSSDDRGDSVSTQFMKKLGYGGVDTRGTKSADTDRGIVIYDLKEDSVLQANITDNMAKQTEMAEKLHYEAGQIYDEESDLQYINEQARKSAEAKYRNEINAEYEKLHVANDVTKQKEKLLRLQKQYNDQVDKRNHGQHIKDNAYSLALEQKREIEDSGFEVNDDELKGYQEEYIKSAEQMIKQADAVIKRVEPQISKLQAVVDAENNSEKADYAKAKAIVDARNTPKDPQNELIQGVSQVQTALENNTTALNDNTQALKQLVGSASDTTQNIPNVGIKVGISEQQMTTLKEQVKQVQAVLSEVKPINVFNSDNLTTVSTEVGQIKQLANFEPVQVVTDAQAASITEFYNALSNIQPITKLEPIKLEFAESSQTFVDSLKSLSGLKDNLTNLPAINVLSGDQANNIKAVGDSAVNLKVASTQLKTIANLPAAKVISKSLVTNLQSLSAMVNDIDTLSNKLSGFKNASLVNPESVKQLQQALDFTDKIKPIVVGVELNQKQQEAVLEQIKKLRNSARIGKVSIFTDNAVGDMKSQVANVIAQIQNLSSVNGSILATSQAIDRIKQSLTQMSSVKLSPITKTTVTNVKNLADELERIPQTKVSVVTVKLDNKSRLSTVNSLKGIQTRLASIDKAHKIAISLDKKQLSLQELKEVANQFKQFTGKKLIDPAGMTRLKELFGYTTQIKELAEAFKLFPNLSTSLKDIGTVDFSNINQLANAIKTLTDPSASYQIPVGKDFLDSVVKLSDEIHKLGTNVAGDVQTLLTPFEKLDRITQNVASSVQQISTQLGNKSVKDVVGQGKKGQIPQTPEEKIRNKQVSNVANAQAKTLDSDKLYVAGDQIAWVKMLYDDLMKEMSKPNADNNVIMQLKQDITETVEAYKEYKSSIEAVKKTQAELNEIISNADGKYTNEQINEQTALLNQLQIDPKDLWDVSKIKASLKALEDAKQKIAEIQAPPQLNNGEQSVDDVSAAIDKQKVKLEEQRKLADDLNLSTVFEQDFSQQDAAINKLSEYIQKLRDSGVTVIDTNNDQEYKKIIADFEKISQLQNRIKGKQQDDRSVSSVLKLRAQYDNLAVSVQSYYDKNTKLKRDNGLNQQFLDLQKNIKLAVTNSEMSTQGLKSFTAQLNNLKQTVSSRGLTGRSLGDDIAYIAEKLGIKAMLGNSIYRVIGYFKQMFTVVKDLNTQMTQLKRVTSETEASYIKFLKNTTTLAQNLGSTMNDVVSAVTSFVKLGYEFEQAQTLQSNAIVYKTVGDLDIERATDDMITAMKAFNITAEDSIHIVDAYDIINNKYAISAQQAGEAIANSAAALATANNTFEQSAAMATAITEITQDASSAGSALKTLSLRVRGQKAELQEAGESTDDLASSTAKLRSTIKGLTGVDIMMENDPSTFKSTYQIMSEIAEVWGSLSDINKATVLEQLAGKTRANQVAALLNNWSTAEKQLNSALNSTGVALNENRIYLDSIEGRIATLKSTQQGLSNDIISEEFEKSVISLGDGLLRLVDIIQTLDDKFLDFAANKILSDDKAQDDLEVVKKYIDVLDKIPGIIGQISAALSAANMTTFLSPFSKEQVQNSLFKKSKPVAEDIFSGYGTGTTRLGILSESDQKAAKQIENYRQQNAEGQQLAETIQQIVAGTNQATTATEQYLATVERAGNRSLATMEGRQAEIMKFAESYGSTNRKIFDRKNIKNVIKDYNSLADGTGKITDKQKSFAEKFSTSDAKLSQHLKTVENGQTSYGQYIGSLIKTEQQTIQTTAATMQFNAVLSMGISFAISGVISLVTQLVNHEKDLADVGSKAAETFREEQDALDDQIDKIKEYKKQLESGNLTEEKAYDVRSDLLTIQQELYDTYGQEAAGIDLVNSNLTTQLELLKGISKEKAGDYLNKHAGSIKSARDYLDKRHNISADASQVGSWLSNDFAIALSNSEWKSVGLPNETIDSELQKEFEKIVSEQGLTLTHLTGGVNNARTSSFVQAVNMTTEETIEAWSKLEESIRKSEKLQGIDLSKFRAQIEEEIKDLDDDTYKANQKIKEETAYATILDTPEYLKQYESIVDGIDAYRNAILKGDTELAATQAGILGDLQDQIVNGNIDDSWVKDYLLKMFDQVSAEIARGNYIKKVQDAIEKGIDGLTEGERTKQDIINQFGKTIDDQTLMGYYSIGDTSSAEYQLLQKYADEAGLTIPNLITAWVELGYVQTDAANSAASVAKKYSAIAEEFEKTHEALNKLDAAYKQIASGEILDYSTVSELLELYPSLYNSVEQVAGGYKIQATALDQVRKAYIEKQRAEKQDEINGYKQSIDKYQETNDNNQQILDSIESVKQAEEQWNQQMLSDDINKQAEAQFALNDQYSQYKKLTGKEYYNQSSKQIEQQVTAAKNQIKKNKESIDDVNDSISFTEFELESLDAPAEKFSETLSTVKSKMDSINDCIKNMLTSMRKFGSITPESLFAFQELVPNWQDYITQNDRGEFEFGATNSQIESMIKSSSGYTSTMNRIQSTQSEATKSMKEAGAQIEDEARKYHYVKVEGESYEKFVQRVILGQSKTGKSSQECATTLGRLSKQYSNQAQSAADATEQLSLLDQAILNIIDSYRKSDGVIQFDVRVEKLDRDVALGSLGDSAEQSAYGSYLNDLKNGYIDETGKFIEGIWDSSVNDFKANVTEADKQTYWNAVKTYHDKVNANLSDDFNDAKRKIQEQYQDKLISPEEYKAAISAINEQYYGAGTQLGGTEEGTEQYEANLREIEAMGKSIFDDNIKELDRLKEQGIIDVHQYWEAYRQEAENNLAGVAQLTDDYNAAMDNYNTSGLKAMYDDDLKHLQRNYDDGLITTQDYLAQCEDLWRKYFKDKKQFADEDYETQKELLEKTKAGIQEQVDALEDEKKARTAVLNAEVDALNEKKDDGDKIYDDQIDALEEQLKLLNKQKEQEEKIKELEEKRLAIEEAMRDLQKSYRVVYAGGGQMDVREDADARKKLEEAKKAAEVDNTKAIQDQIDALNEAKEKFDKGIDKEVQSREKAIADIERPLDNLINVLTLMLAENHNYDPKFIESLLTDSDAGKAAMDEYNKQLAAKNAIHKKKGNEEVTPQVAAKTAEGIENKPTKDYKYFGGNVEDNSTATEDNTAAVNKNTEAVEEAANSAVTQDDYNKFVKQMVDEFQVGNVDLANRPMIKNADGTTSTVLTQSEILWQGGEEDGRNVMVHFTPILPDGTILSDDELEKYLYEVLTSSKDILEADKNGLGIVLKVDEINLPKADLDALENGIKTDKMQKFLDDVEKWDVELHDKQAEWVKLYEAVFPAKDKQADKTAEETKEATEELTDIEKEINAKVEEIKKAALNGKTVADPTVSIGGQNYKVNADGTISVGGKQMAVSDFDKSRADKGLVKDVAKVLNKDGHKVKLAVHDEKYIPIKDVDVKMIKNKENAAFVGATNNY